MNSDRMEVMAGYLGGTPHNVPLDLRLPLDRVKTDSRTIGPGDVYVPLAGERTDGHRFIEAALKNGAVLALCSQAHFHDHRADLENLPLLVVQDPLEALQQMARWVIDRLDAVVVAVTGSTGKTTTKDFIAAVLAEEYTVVKTQGNYNNHIGLPLTVLQAQENTEILVLEMGMNHFGEIDRLVRIAPPQVAVITNIGSSHIEHLGSREGILKAKLEITGGLGPDGLLVLNGADDLLRRQADYPSVYQKTLFDTHDAAHLITSITADADYCHRYTLTGPNGQVHVALSVPGRHNVENSAAAALIGLKFGIDPNRIALALHSYVGEKMRMSILETQQGYRIINDAYNASIDSMRSSLDLLAHIEAVKRVAFLGDMLEMGDHAERGHRRVGDFVDLDRIDYVLTYGEQAAWIGKRLMERGFDAGHCMHMESFEEAAAVLKTILGAGDVLLIKGSRGMAMETIIHQL